MLTFLGDLLQGIWDFLSFAFSLIIGLFEDLIYFIGLLSEIPALFTSAFAWVPPAVFSVIILCVSIIIILRVIGRD